MGLVTAEVQVAIGWDQVGRQMFERIVEATVYRLYPDADDIQVINGRGGDGGRDILVVQGSRARIFQLKYFPEGFSSKWADRRAQIKVSFEAALRHRPYEWRLVVPCTVTPGERAYVQRLAAGHNVKTSVMDRSELDHRLAGFPDIEAYFMRDVLKEDAVIFNQEKTMLYGGARDLAERVTSLGRVVDQCDPDWTVDFTRSGNTVIRSLRPKHPHAHLASPIRIDMELMLGSEHAGLAAALTRRINFGTAEEMTFPAEVVRRLSVIGPPWLSHTSNHVEVSWQPLRHVPEPDAPVELRFIGESGDQLAAHQGVLRHGSHGHLGYALEAQFHRAASMRFLFPFDDTELGTLNCDLTLDQADPTTALRTVELVQYLRTCEQLDILVAGKRLGEYRFPRNRVALEAATDADLADLHGLASDLDVVQRHCNVHFPIPESIDPSERVLLRFARLLIEGHCAIHPQVQTLTFELNGTDSPPLRHLLSGDPRCLKLEQHDYTIDFAGRQLRLGRVALFHTQLAARNHREITEALDAGRAAGLPVTLQPTDGQRFRAYMPDKITDPNWPLTPTPWALQGIAEPSETTHLA